MTKAIDSLLLNGKTMHAEIRQAIKRASITRAFDSSPTLTMEVHDPKRTLLRSGIFKERTTAQFYDFSFELAQTKKTGSGLLVVMEDLAVAELRRWKTPRPPAAKGTVTRVQFVQQILADETPWIKLNVDPSVKEPVAQVALARGSISTQAADQIDPAYGGSPASGAPAGSSVGALSASQIAGVALAAGFPVADVPTMVAIAFAESGGQPSRQSPPNTNGTTDLGLWQINSSHKALLATGNWADPVTNGKMALTLYQGRINSQGASKRFSDWVTYNKGSYKQFLAKAQAAAGSPSNDYASAGATTYGESPEDSWTCFKRIFAAVHWRIYADKGQLYAGPDSAFINKDPIVTLEEFKNGVNEIDFDIDTNKPTATVSIDARMDYWACQPGSVMAIANLGLTTEKWLCSSITRNLFKSDTKIEGTSPQPELVEPASDSDGYDTNTEINSTGLTDGSGKASNGEYVWPVNGRKISSPFGATDGRNHSHKGIDIAVPDGTPVYASRAGVVTQADNSDASGYGLAVYISHRTGGADSFVGPVGPAAMTDESRYGHLSKLICRRGQYVKQGDQIGLSGHTGNATGPCLHFEIRVNGEARNPEDFLSNGKKVTVTLGDFSVATPKPGGTGGGASW